MSICGSDLSVTIEIVTNSSTSISSNTTSSTITTTSIIGSVGSTTATITASRLTTASNSYSTLCAKFVPNKSSFGSSIFSYSASVSE